MPVTSMQEMLLSPVMTRRTLVHGTETRRKRTKIAIATSKAATFDAAAIDKTYKGSKIVKVTEPLDASYS